MTAVEDATPEIAPVTEPSPVIDNTTLPTIGPIPISRTSSNCSTVASTNRSELGSTSTQCRARRLPL